jgi:hypothetical protein
MNALARPRLRRWRIVLLLTTTVLVGVAALSYRRTSKAEISLLRQTGGLEKWLQSAPAQPGP